MDERRRLCVCSAGASVSTSLSPQIGERFAGRYELKAPLRGDGVVRAFLAFDHHAGLDVALLLFDPVCTHPSAWGAFARVVAAATAGKVAGLVLPQGVGSIPPVSPFCLAEPQALRGFDRLRDQGMMPWQRALTLGERAAEILHAAHVATGVAHRVLMPSRCAVTVRDDVRVLDFGVAELELGRPDEGGYRAPEQQEGGGDERSDVYTLAVILFELISGQKSTGKPLQSLRSLVAVPRPVDEFMAKALSRDPAQRLGLAATRAALRELLGMAAAPAEATHGEAPGPGANLATSPVAIVSAPPGASVAASVTTPVKSGYAVGAGATPANVETSPARPVAPTAVPTAGPLLPRPEVAPPWRSPAVAPWGGLPTVREPQKSDRADLMIQDRTEELPAPRRPAPAIADRTEILAVASPPAPAVVDRTEILAGVSRPTPAIADMTEIHAGPERTEVVRSDVATAQDEEKTVPRKSLTSSLVALALARAKASAADPDATRFVTSDDLPTEKSVKPLLTADTTLLLPPESASPVVAGFRAAGDVRPQPPKPARPEPVGLQPAAEARPLTVADPNEATTVFRPGQAPTIPKPAEDRFRKALIQVNIVFFSVGLLVMLWLLLT